MRHLVIDSGASKAEWVYYDGERTHTMKTSGIHPYYLDSTDAFHSFSEQFSSFYSAVKAHPFDHVYFYGTGCSDLQSKQMIEAKLKEHFERMLSVAVDKGSNNQNLRIVVATDLDGAAKATFPDSEGIMILLGTGSIFAHVRDGNIVRRIPSLGYVLGDEGSAACLGKKIYTGFYRKMWSEETLSLIQQRTEFRSYGDEMSMLYSNSQPSAHLGKIARMTLIHPMTDELLLFLKQELMAAFSLAGELLLKSAELDDSLSVHEPETCDRRATSKLCLPIALSGGVIQAHSDVALSCAEMIFHGHKVTVYPSFAQSVSRYLVEGKIPGLQE